MTLIDLLKISGVDSSKSIKIMRHSNKHDAVIKLFDENLEMLEKYQAIQNIGNLNCDYVVSCLKDDKNKTIVQAVYEVKSHRPATKADLSTNDIIQTLLESENVDQLEYTHLERVSGFADLEKRVVINWGGAAIKWLQSLNNNPKPIVEIRARGKIEQFLNYDQVLLTYQQLQAMINYPEANREWHQMLSVNGIYLISNNRTGQLYVGSAYGKKGDKGILGRWSEYARTGHGGNKRLVSLLKANPKAIDDMQYSILTTVASNKTDTEIINLENFYKKKLGRSAVTLNHEGHLSHEVKIERRKLLVNYLQQFLHEQHGTDEPPKLPLSKYNKVDLTDTQKLFYAFISEDGVNEILLVKQLKIGKGSLYLEFNLDGKRHLVITPWQRKYVLELHEALEQSAITDDREVREVGIIDKSDRPYFQLAVEGRLGYGHSIEETEFKEIVAQLSGKDGWYDAYIMNEPV
ncbi:hypothetical protein BKE30_01675 [Alkanindiges hydrocarboniclasticus]|uniref:GIY-YIG domain-containing protein n=1 Tax=Alkanindiges hydrocarboniclasticus TaxID=1907941 RepID=A0A1S8CXE1_9GAMM|nr:GIY-YIG nuclease family protein [Alkanindiges hydrocarboniclasticus]ONG42001.1 hypothetical protein BKE30_01675 [Alkanindiges hydrocarboniclasticus]